MNDRLPGLRCCTLSTSQENLNLPLAARNDFSWLSQPLAKPNRLFSTLPKPNTSSLPQHPPSPLDTPHNPPPPTPTHPHTPPHTHPHTHTPTDKPATPRSQ